MSFARMRLHKGFVIDVKVLYSLPECLVGQDPRALKAGRPKGHWVVPCL